MSSLGKNFRITIFGASHGEAIGVVMEGLPVGFAIDMDALNAFLTRRAPGRGAFATARRESDAPLFLSGVKNGVTCGGAVAAVIRNGDAHPGDYDALRNTPRPGHADFAARMKDGDAVDLSGGGRFSGRLTAPLCVAGGIAMQLLEEENIRIVSHIASIAGIADEGIFPASTLGKPFPTLSEARGEEMLAAIAKARADGDSVGGVVECAVLGLPAGLGDALFDGVESRLSAALFGIPAVKGVEFGRGAFKAKSGVYARFGQVFPFARGNLVILHEHQIPDFQKAVAIAPAYAAIVAAFHVLALIKQNFGTRAAGAGVAHCPEIVFLAQLENALTG